MFFVIINTLFVISYFIAMTTTLYWKKGKFKEYYYNQSTLEIRPITWANKTSSVMVSVPVPFSALHIFYTSCLLSFRDKQAEILNLVLLHIFYVPIAIGCSIVFLVWSLILLPFCFVKVFYHKFAVTFAYSKYYKISRPQKYLYVWTWLCYGSLILLANIVRDLAIFFIHLYQLNPEVMNAERYNKPFLP